MEAETFDFRRRVRALAAALLVLTVPSSPFSPSAFAAAPSEIKVDLRLDASDFVVGERIRGVVDIANSSSERISVGYANSVDGAGNTNRFFVEVFRASDLRELTRVSRHQFVARFVLESGKGQKLETFLSDHFGLAEPSRYLARPVLVHGRIRYEGTLRAFDVVDGVKIGSAMQVFKNRPGVQRNFSLLYWSRNHSEHLFLAACDSGGSTRKWETRDLGSILRLDRPTISIMPKGEVIVLHRLNQDQYVRTEFWSLPDALEFRGREAVLDPETAGTSRVRELYKEGGVKPKENPWWKIW